MKVYSFLNTVLLVNGAEIVEWDEGDDVIQVERLGDSASHVIGADGNMVVSLSADRSGVIRFRLQQTSPSNAALTNLISNQESGVFTPVEVQFKDLRGSDKSGGTKGYIPKPPNFTRGVNASSQEWSIVLETLNMDLQGNEAV